VLLGDAPDFSVATLPHDGAATRPLLGTFAGLLAVAYNRALLPDAAALAAAGLMTTVGTAVLRQPDDKVPVGPLALRP
jgi:hypothetical protein